MRGTHRRSDALSVSLLARLGKQTVLYTVPMIDEPWRLTLMLQYPEYAPRSTALTPQVECSICWHEVLVQDLFDAIGAGLGKRRLEEPGFLQRGAGTVAVGALKEFW